MSIALRDQLIKSIIFQFGEQCRESLSIQGSKAGKIRVRTGREKMRPPSLSAKEKRPYVKVLGRIRAVKYGNSEYVLYKNE